MKEDFFIISCMVRLYRLILYIIAAGRGKQTILSNNCGDRKTYDRTKLYLNVILLKFNVLYHNSYI